MTTITVYKKDGKIKGFDCIGHAEYDVIQKDIVCSAISILVINTINSIEKFTKDPCNITQSQPEGKICCHLNDNVSEQSNLLLNAMVLGLTEIKKQYGKKYIDVKFEEV